MIKKIEDRRFEVNIRDENNIRRVRLFDSEEEAKLFEGDILKSLPPKGQRKRHHDTSTETMGEFILSVIEAEKGKLAIGKAKYGTIHRWESNLRLLPDWLKEKRLISVTEHDCERFLKHLQTRPHFVNGKAGEGSVPRSDSPPLSEETIASKFGFLVAMLERAVKEKKGLRRNPAENVKLSKTRKGGKDQAEIEDEDRLRRDEASHFLKLAACLCQPLLFVLFSVMALAGLRYGEARSLQLQDLQLDYTEVTEMRRRPRIYVQRTEWLGVLGWPKTWVKRFVDVCPVLEAILRIWIALLPQHPHAWLFRAPRLPREGSKRRKAIETGKHGIDLTQHGWCVSPSHVREQWTKLIRVAQLGRKLSPLCLRHTFATLSLEAGEDLFYVSKQLGHKTTHITQRIYAKWANPKGRGAFAQVAHTMSLPSESLNGKPEGDLLLAKICTQNNNALAVLGQDYWQAPDNAA